MRPIPLDEIGRVLVIRRNRMGDMICTLPLLRALRKSLPGARLKVLTEAAGAPIAQASAVVDEVETLRRGLGRWGPVLLNFASYRGNDLVIAVKGGYDQLLAAMTRMTGARYRIGFAGIASEGSRAFTHPVELPSDNRHQIETCNCLLQPLGITDVPLYLHLQLPRAVREFARETLAKINIEGKRIVLLNLSHTIKESWPLEKYIQLARQLLAGRSVVLFSSLPRDFEKAEALRTQLALAPHNIVRPPSALHLAGLLEHAGLLVTLEGGAAHLAACTNTPAVILWSSFADFTKWRSRGEKHVCLSSQTTLADISVDEVLEGIAGLLPAN